MRRFLVFIFIALIGCGGYGAWALNRPLPVLQPHSVLATLPSGSEPVLTWPAYGSAAVGAVGYGLLESHGPQKAVPTASVAKVLTALAVLEKEPLKLGDQGPTLTLGAQDVTFYNDYVAEQGSVVPVNYGEQLSEYQALQALLLPSANNMAESMAYWAFGSVPAYTAFANNYAKQLGLKNTHVADASGFSPETTSTASDLVLLGEAALQNPVIAQIVSQSSADIPVAGTITNVNTQLGQSGINGIKTGNTDQAGGVYLASATYTVDGHPITLISAVTEAPTLDDAMHDSVPLLASEQKGFGGTTILHTGDTIGYYNTPWHTSANAVTDHDLQAFGWKGSIAQPSVSLQSLQVPSAHGQTVGTIKLKGSLLSAVSLQQGITPPSWEWRLLHP